MPPSWCVDPTIVVGEVKAYQARTTVSISLSRQMNWMALTGHLAQIGVISLILNSDHPDHYKTLDLGEFGYQFAGVCPGVKP